MTTINTEIPFFSRRELACKGTGAVRLDKRFADALVALRTEWGKPLDPTSVCRTPQHNKNVGGHPNSLHLTINEKRPTNGTMAIDINWRNWSKDLKLEFARFAWQRGWAVGLHEGFIHLDRRKDIGMKPTIFLYGVWQGAFGAKEIQQ
jgi:zinc D-Ala-D-Ala carboxypeptidase